MVRTSLKDPALAELVRTKNFKQALKNTEKKLKKQPKDVELLLTKTDLLVRNGDLEEALKSCMELIARQPPIAEVETVERLHEISQELAVRGPGIPMAQLESLWQNLIKARSIRSQKISAADAWVDQSLYYSQWTFVAKAAATLAKLHPDDEAAQRKYYYWQVISHWLTQPAANVTDERMKNLGKQMACRMLEKAVENTPSSSDTEKTVKTGHKISKRQDFDLLKHVFLASGRQRELLVAIDQGKFNHASSVGVDEWQVNATKAELLVQRGENKPAWEMSKDLLQGARTAGIGWKQDDWSYWKRLCDASTSEENEKTQELVEQALASKPRSRAAELARLESCLSALVTRSQGASTTNGSDDLSNRTVTLAVAYFKQYSNTPGCAADLAHLSSALDTEHFMLFRNEISRWIHSSAQRTGEYEASLESLNTELALLNIEYKNRVRSQSSDSVFAEAKTEYTSNQKYDFFVATLRDCLDLSKRYQRLNEQRPRGGTNPGDEACLLAIDCIGELINYELSDACSPSTLQTLRAKYSVLACALLEKLLEHSAQNTDAKIMLMNLYSFLALQGAALPHFERLRVKGLMTDMICPIVFTRISATLPAGMGRFEPLKMMKKHVDFYSDTLAQLSTHTRTALNSENWVSATDNDALRKNTKNNNTRIMLTMESRRIARLLGVDSGIPHDEADGASPTYSDTVAERRDEWYLSMSARLLPNKELPFLYPRYITWSTIIDRVMEIAQPSFALWSHDFASQDIADIVEKLRIDERDHMGTSESEAAVIRPVQRLEESIRAMWEFARSEDHGSSDQVIAKRQGFCDSLESLISAVSHYSEVSDRHLSQHKTEFDAFPLPSWEVYSWWYLELELQRTLGKLDAKLAAERRSDRKLQGKEALPVATRLERLRKFAIQRCAFIQKEAAEWKTKLEAIKTTGNLMDRLFGAQQGPEYNVEDSVQKAVVEVVGAQGMEETLKKMLETAIEALQSVSRVSAR